MSIIKYQRYILVCFNQRAECLFLDCAELLEVENLENEASSSILRRVWACCLVRQLVAPTDFYSVLFRERAGCNRLCETVQLSFVA